MPDNGGEVLEEQLIKALGSGVPCFNTFFTLFFLKGTIMKYKFILFSPWPQTGGLLDFRSLGPLEILGFGLVGLVVSQDQDDLLRAALI